MMFKATRVLGVFLWVFTLGAHAIPNEDVLLVGDSQSYGSFGGEFVKAARARGWKVSAYARPGASALWYWRGHNEPNTWGSWEDLHALGERRSPQGAPTPLLKDLIAKHNPTWVIVQLGGNMAWTSHDLVTEQSEALAREIAASSKRCLWVGPPPGDKRPPAESFDAFYAVLQKAAESKGCVFVDTRKIIAPPIKGGDGIHLDTMGAEGRKAALRWAQDVVEHISRLKASAAP